MKLKLRLLKWSTGLPVAMLHEKTAEKIGVNSKERVLIKTLSKKSIKISAILDTIKDMAKDIVKENEIGVSLELGAKLNIHNGKKVSVTISSPSESLEFIKKKLNKKRLSQKEIEEIIEDIVDNSLSEIEVALFISAMYQRGMTEKETIFLIKSILKTGSKLSLGTKEIVDKHCIGGIPGNRTTPIIVPICASKGLIFPKTSSRAITSAAGTADTIETIAKVDFSLKEIEKIIKETNACMVWGGSLGLVPADDKIIAIEKVIKIDPEAQLLASIMAKKLSVGSKYILIDIPCGKNAKVDKRKALNIKEKFEELGRHFKKEIKVVLTNGDQPIGNGIGPSLEMRDVIDILDPKKQGPKDLEEKSLFLAGEIFELSGKTKRGKGYELAKQILDSGEAFAKFKQIIYAQHGNINRIRPAKFKKDIFVKRYAKVHRINNKLINDLARAAGCPADKFSGVYLYAHVGEKISKGNKLITIYSDSKERLMEAIKFYNKNHPIILR
ncbi:MAG: thymidine phosphorylase [archaeon]